MAIKAGQILHLMNQFVVDRIQTAGGQLNIPQEKVNELGNFQSVATVRDNPELTFSVDCLDVSTELEALLTGGTAGDLDVDGTEYDLSTNIPLDIVSPFKSAVGNFTAVAGVAVPYLYMESASYRYGLRDNAGEQISLKGDSLYYCPGTPFVCKFTATGGQTVYTYNDGQATPASLTALKYVQSGLDIYALCVTVNGRRLFAGSDYTSTASDVTFTTPLEASDAVSVVIAVNPSGAPSSVTTYGSGVHAGTTVKPAAIKGKDIDVYLIVPGATPARVRWTDVQSVNVDWRIQLEEDFEFGNPNAVARDAADVPTVSGSIEIKPYDVDALLKKLREITGLTSTTEVIGPATAVPVGLEIVLKNPASGGSSAVAAGEVLKTLYVEDARFTIPGYEGRVQQKMTQTMNFESDTGQLKIYKGAKP